VSTPQPRYLCRTTVRTGPVDVINHAPSRAHFKSHGCLGEHGFWLLKRVKTLQTSELLRVVAALGHKQLFPIPKFAGVTTEGLLIMQEPIPYRAAYAHINKCRVLGSYA